MTSNNMQATMSRVGMTDMEKRLADKIQIGRLNREIEALNMRIKLDEFTIDELLVKIDHYEKLLDTSNLTIPPSMASMPFYKGE